MHSSDEYIGLKELSKRTSLSPRALRNWMGDPDHPFPAYRVGGRLLFKWSDVEEWIEQFRVEPVDVDAVVDEFTNTSTNDGEGTST